MDRGYVKTTSLVPLEDLCIAQCRRPASSDSISPHPGTIFAGVFGCANNGKEGRSEKSLLNSENGFRCHGFGKGGGELLCKIAPA